jgi:hypothetical protein
MATTDKGLGFSDEQVVTVSAKSTKTIDIGPKTWAGNAMGITDDPIAIAITIEEAFAGGTSLAIGYRSSDSSDMSGATTHYTTPAIALASLTLGAQPFPSMYMSPDSKRYVDLFYTVVGTMTLGKISAFGAVALPSRMT